MATILNNNCMERYIDLIKDKLITWGDTFFSSLPNIAVALVALFFFYMGAKLGKYLTKKIVTKFSDNSTLNYLFSTITFVFIISLGMILALNILNLEKAVTSLLAGAGIIGLAIGFAFQDISTNFISGIFITFRRPFKVGDIISSQDFFGRVEKIDLRETTIQTFQGLHVLIPNKDVQNTPLINYTKTHERRVDLEVGVAYNTDLDLVSKVAKETLETLPFRKEENAVGVFFKEFADSSINMHLNFWIDYPDEPSYVLAKSKVIVAIKKAFDKNNINIPFPIRTLDFSNQLSVTKKE